MKNSQLILIGGGSCSGKTSVAADLVARLTRPTTDRRAPGAVMIGLDSYYHDFSAVPESEIQVDIPDALDHVLFIPQIKALLAGHAVDQPVYDYKTHARTKQTRRIVSALFVIVVGLFALHWQELADLSALAVFVDAPHDVCLARRITRDQNERGRDPEHTREQYAAVVLPMYERHVAPTRSRANMIIDGTKPIVALTDALLGTLQSGDVD
jgi:uridine kinase